MAEYKEWLKMLAMFLMIEMFIYLMFSFYWLGVNPALWSEESRGGFSFLSVVFAFMIVMVRIMIKEKLKNHG